MVIHATIKDAKEIYDLINYYSDQGVLLPRILADIYDNIQKFFILKNKSTGKILGVASLQVCWLGDNETVLGEIRSVAVDPMHGREGYGRELISHIIKEAKTLKLSKVFILTYAPGIFSKYGFIETSLEGIPGRKIWLDCINCKFFPPCSDKCKETPMVMLL